MCIPQYWSKISSIKFGRFWTGTKFTCPCQLYSWVETVYSGSGELQIDFHLQRSNQLVWGQIWLCAVDRGCDVILCWQSRVRLTNTSLTNPTLSSPKKLCQQEEQGRLCRRAHDVKAQDKGSGQLKFSVHVGVVCPPIQVSTLLVKQPQLSVYYVIFFHWLGWGLGSPGPCCVSQNYVAHLVNLG